jgi:hypothetical protein
MALCFGVYVNGIAGYGRDSLLGCESASYNSKQQKCGHLKEGGEDQAPQFCFYEELPTGYGNETVSIETVDNGTAVEEESTMYMGFGEPTPLDWRNCSAGTGH